MREAIRLTVFFWCCGLIASCAMPPQEGGGPVDPLLEELVALERSALDRWIRLDAQGYLELFASDATYFDPFTERRVSGREVLQARLGQMKTIKLPFSDPRYEMSIRESSG
jgi:hypothetical protein